MMNNIILTTFVLSSSSLFAGGAIGGAGGGGSLAKKLSNISLMQVNEAIGDLRFTESTTMSGKLKEALVRPHDFTTIVNKSLLRESVIVDEQEYIGVDIDQDAQTVELAPSDRESPYLLVRPSN